MMKMETLSEQCQQYLKNHEIPYQTLNDGIHLRVMGTVTFLDFYPSTGKWLDNLGCDHFGLKSLITYCEET